MRTRELAVAAALIASTTIWCGTASGHAFIEMQQASAGAFHTVEVGIPHGCQGTATHTVRIKVPEGIGLANPQPKPGWKLSYTKRKLAKPVVLGEGAQRTEVTDEVTWSGGKLLDSEFERFSMLVLLPDTPNVPLYFKTIQLCEKGENRWVDIPAAGQSWGALKAPAPFINLMPTPPFVEPIPVRKSN